MKQSRTEQSQLTDVLFSNRNINELNAYFEEYQTLDLIELVDSQGNTVLHQLAYEGYLDIIQLFVKQARKQITERMKKERKKMYQKNQSQQITVWLNKSNNEGFTPLLYASYSGHLNIIKFLIEEHQVNEKILTNSGLNVLHLAAQKNVIAPFLYFRERIGLEEKDSLNSSALHWAAYMNSEDVVAYILSQTLASMDEKDNDGNTPLLVAVTYGNTRVVRRLLMKGADRSIKNNEQKTPLDVANQNQFKTIKRMLNEQFTAGDMIKFYCNVKIQYKPKKRKWNIPIIFLITLIINLGILNAFINFNKDYQYYAEVGIFLPLILLYFSLLRGPPHLQALDYSDVLRSKNKKSLKKMCFECKNSIPKRGYHCDVCRVCIKQYDHHCAWINNCVGKRNIGRFIFFLIFLILSFAFIGLFSFLALFSTITDQPVMYEEWFSYRFNQNQSMERILLTVLFLVTFLTSLFIFPVLVLLVVQLKNLFKNKTTYETIRGPAEYQNQIKNKMRRYNSRVSIRNCQTMCKDHSSSFSSQSSGKSGQLITDQYSSEKAG